MDKRAIPLEGVAPAFAKAAAWQTISATSPIPFSIPTSAANLLADNREKRTIPPMRLRLAFGLSLLVSTAALAQNSPTSAELPPMPALESRRGLPPEQREAVDRRNGETLSTWHRRFSGKAP